MLDLVNGWLAKAFDIEDEEAGNRKTKKKSVKLSAEVQLIFNVELHLTNLFRSRDPILRFGSWSEFWLEDLSFELNIII